MEQHKIDFLKTGFTQQLSVMDATLPPLWGKMNFQQMVEHMSDYVRIGSGVTPVELVTPEEHLPKMQAFLLSDKPFRENTPNPLLPDIPVPVKHGTVSAAIDELQQELDHLFEVFQQEPEKRVLNPFFGHLDYEMSVQLLYKHGKHHLRQFGAAE
ncbi:hypothetical protein ACTHGU_10950 [Chitinophagaceae bacterium MMS25-I14]